MAYPCDELKCAPLAVLAHRINQYQETLDGYTRNALQVAMDQGDVLALAKRRVGNRKWKTYREENCPKVAERTDALHRQLAAHRAIIETAIKDNPDLNVREAVELIKKPKVSTKVQKVPGSTGSSETTIVVATKPAAPTIVVSPRVPAAPLGDSARGAVLGLAQQALSIARRPVSAPNNERVQELLLNIIQEAKTVKQSPQPPALMRPWSAKPCAWPHSPSRRSGS